MERRMQRHTLLILGGGFGGVRVAQRIGRALARNPQATHYDLALVTQQDHHLFTPNLYELAVAPTLRAQRRALMHVTALPYDELFRNLPVRLIHDTVTGIDTATRTVSLSTQPTEQYDTLVIALGSVVSYFDIPGLSLHALPFKTAADAERISIRLIDCLARSAPPRIVIAGAGPAGVELAARMQESVRLHADAVAVTLLEGNADILHHFPPTARTYVRRSLQRRGVRIVTGSRINRVDARTLILDDGREFGYDLLVWTGGVTVSPLMQRLPIQRDGGRAMVAPTMTCMPLHDDLHISSSVYAIGDAVCVYLPSGAAVPWQARPALDQADVVAHNIIERIRTTTTPTHRPHMAHYRPYAYPYIIPVGRRRALANVFGITIWGLPAWILKEVVELAYFMSILPIRRAFRRWSCALRWQ